MNELFLVLVVLTAPMTFLPSSALAEEPATRLEDIHVPGVVHGPSVRVFLSRSRPSTQRVEPRASFTREIVSSTSSSPF